MSTAGQLQHAATVVRTFIAYLFDLSTMVAKPNHYVQLNKGAKSDIAWSHKFLELWNSVSLLSSLGEESPPPSAQFCFDLWCIGIVGVWGLLVMASSIRAHILIPYYWQVSLTAHQIGRLICNNCDKEFVGMTMPFLLCMEGVETQH